MSDFYKEIINLTKESKASQLNALLSSSIIAIKDHIKTAALRGEDDIVLELPHLSKEIKEELAHRFYKLGFNACVKKVNLEANAYTYNDPIGRFEADCLCINWK